MIVDSCNEIAGASNVPHHCIGGARRVQIPQGKTQSDIMIEVVENHTPDVMIIDEVGCPQEVSNCQTIAERGVQLIATAHGSNFRSIIKNPVLNKLVGGVRSVTLSGKEVEGSATDQRSVQERAGSPTFPILVELWDPKRCIVHWVKDSMDLMLRGKTFNVQMREKIAEDGTCLSMCDYRDAISTFSSIFSQQSSLMNSLSCMNKQNAKKHKFESPSLRSRVTGYGQEMMNNLSSACEREYLRMEPPYGCTLCSVKCVSLKSLHSHAMGRRHWNNYHDSCEELFQFNPFSH